MFLNYSRRSRPFSLQLFSRFIVLLLCSVTRVYIKNKDGHENSINLLMAYYKTRNTRKRNNGTGNTGGRVEQRNTPMHQQNTSGISRKNGTLHDEEQLHLIVDYKLTLKLNEHLESILKEAGRNVNAFLRIVPYKNFEK